jgi:hypothetical protein
LYADQSVHLRVPEYRIELTPGGFHQIIVDQYYSYGVPGYPDVPSKIYRIAVPPGVELRSIKVEFIELESISLGSLQIRELPPMATWADGQQTVAEKASVYSNDAYYPEKTVELLGVSQMRKWRLVNVKYNPFRYNPVTRDLRYSPRVAVTVRYPGRREGVAADAELADGIMEERAQKKIINYPEAKDWYTPSIPVPMPSQIHNYVIITTNAIEAASATLTSFVSYLASRGFSPLVITENEYGVLAGQSPNGTAEKIRQWLINNYVSYGIEYVLLVGNPDPSGNVPMKMCWPRRSESTYQESPTDYFYADLTGNWDLDGDGYFGEYPDDDGIGGVDFDNEVYVGRIPVYSGVTNLDTTLTKIMNYWNASSITWRSNALLPMSYSDSTTDGAYLGEAMENNYLSSAGISTWTMYMQGGLCPEANSSFSSNEELLDGATKARWMANPYGMVWWWGHGSSTSASLGYSACGWGTIMSTSDTSSLNDNYPSFVYQCSCNNGYPESSSNLGTALLYRGAIATVSATRVSWYAVTSWSPSLKYYCDNASIGYYYGLELVSNHKGAAAALYDVKSDMGANHYTSWGGCHWMNLFDFNVYGNPVTSLSDQAPAHVVSAPNAPAGASTGQTMVPCAYASGGAVCSLGHGLEYRFDWNDGTYSSWSSSTSASHTWSSVGTYQIKAQARCSVNPAIVSDWSPAFTVTIGTTAYFSEMNLSQASIPIPDSGTYDFGSYFLGSQKETTFAIQNAGAANLVLYGTPIITLTGPGAAEYTVIQQPTTPVPSGTGTTFIIRFNPSSVGQKTAYLSIINNDPDENPYDVTLTGTGTNGYYVLDRWGGVHIGGAAAALIPPAPYFGWDIARDMELNSAGTGYYVLDGWGGIHAGGAASVLTPATPYFGWDIARDMELTPAGTGYYVLDGYGGIHRGGAASVLTPATPYFGWDIARDMVLTPAGTGFYVLDGWGGIHAGGAASALIPATPYFGWDIARDMVLTPAGTGFYVLDGYGGIHKGGTASTLSPATPYFGWNIARDMELTPAGTGFYVLDGHGGLHAGGAAPLPLPATPYFGWDVAIDMEIAART